MKALAARHNWTENHVIASGIQALYEGLDPSERAEVDRWIERCRENKPLD